MRISIALFLQFFLLLTFLTSCAHKFDFKNREEKIYVVQRERESLQVFDNGQVKLISDLGNLNHATMKFKWGKGYLLARNGYISQIDINKDQLIKKVKIGKSGIGLTFTENNIVIVNYDPASVVILSKDLEVENTILTESRNVGVKVYSDFLVFSLMDKNEIWVLDTTKNFQLVKKFENVGNLPFDALVNGSDYLVGFFNEAAIGFLDLKSFSYSKINLNLNESNVVYKVPHFGYWGIVGDLAFVPIAAHKKILIIDMKSKKTVKEIELPGEPVFASVSPDKKNIVVNFSGETENLIAVVDTKKMVVENSFNAGKRVMHIRFSQNSKKLFVTSYFENKMHEYNVDNWSRVNSFDVASPSGVFLNTIVE